MKLKNPYAGRPDYHCFGCSPDNENGLQMSFFLEGEEVVSEWEPKLYFEGWSNIVHGGIQATLMDEIGSWLILAVCKTAGVTTNLQVTYRKAVPAKEGNLKLRARLKESTTRLATVEIQLFAPDGSLCSEGLATYFLFNPEIARKRNMYPGDAFFYETGD